MRIAHHKLNHSPKGSTKDKNHHNCASLDSIMLSPHLISILVMTPAIVNGFTFRNFHHRYPHSSFKNSNNDNNNIDPMKEFELEERAAKIAAMGGDPAFLTYEDLNEEDYIHEDFNGEDLRPEEDLKMSPSLSFLKQMESAPATLDLVESRTSSTKAEEQASGGRLHFAEDGNHFDVTEFDLEEIGGDPAFLAMESSNNGNFDDDNGWGEWDGTVDEAAHLDFD